jgi:uncharacterized protein (TIGR02266 family)
MEAQKRVLLVDRVLYFLEMEKSFFNRENVPVTVAHSGREALKVLKVLAPNLVIVDLEMPDLDGAEVCRRIKDDPTTFTLPVILTVNGPHPDDLERCRAAGCDALIEKPLNRQEMLLVARRFLELSDRATPRVKTRMMVDYAAEGQPVRQACSINLASGGMFLESDHTLPVGTAIGLEFLLPRREQPFRCRGRVVWLNFKGNKAKPGLPVGFGIRFTDLPTAEARAIQEYIHTECRP